jgi:hypothetical protein
MADRLRVTELDFDTIKNNLKSFLNQQSEFTDYDFEGSGLNILLDILAYNTHYNAYYLNMVANESFMDTALLRDSVVSHAKSLGYTPYSTKAPVAQINFTVTTTSTTPATLTLPAGYSFLSNQIDGKSYNFVVLEDTTVTKSNTNFYFENLEIYEGQLVTYTFVHNQSTNPKQVFTLKDSNIDTTTIKVQVSPSTSNTSLTSYSKVTDILDVTYDSNAFYLQESKSGKFQIYFGNDVVGKKLADGSVVYVTYLLNNATAANKANNFVAAASTTDSIGNVLTRFIINPVSAAAGGSERESVDSIKFGSAAQFSTQNRLVTFKDYESYIKKSYPSVDSLTVWGGEEETPPAYGKVYIALKPKQDYYISEAEKTRIINEIIKPKSIIAVDAIIRDPEYLYLLVQNYVEYDRKKTTQSADAIRTGIRNAILTYAQSNLNKFAATFVLSKMQDNVDAVDYNAIRGSETTLKLQKRFEPDLTKSTTYNINFNAELHRGTITNRMTSTEFDVYDSTGIRRTVLLEEVEQSYTGISSVQVTNSGTGYTVAPSVIITGDGSGAAAIATIVNGRVANITVTNRGTGYSRALISLSGGNGYGATASAILDSKIGTLRTVYYDEFVQRQTVNANAGEIYYDTGLIALNDLRVLSVSSTDNMIRLTIESERGILNSAKNTIITIDETDPNCISTELTEY